MKMAYRANTVEDEPLTTRSHASELVCRRMTETDIDAAVGLLAVGFPERRASYWIRGFDRLRKRAVPVGYPRYGYVLADQGRLVGIVLLIFTPTDAGGIRGNVSSWYVDPSHRGYSHLLLAAVFKMKDATLVNISPAPMTLETISAQGFTRYVDGTFIALAALARPVFGAKVRRVTAASQTSLPILRQHTAWGCLVFEVAYGGKTYPFVFSPQRFLGGLSPCTQLVYCSDIQDFVRFAGPLGRRLLRHGLGVILVDANERLGGLPGTYRPGRSPKFSRGEVEPRLGDLSYTELTLFGP